jgi:hypothetical protein
LGDVHTPQVYSNSNLGQNPTSAEMLTIVAKRSDRAPGHRAPGGPGSFGSFRGGFEPSGFGGFSEHGGPLGHLGLMHGGHPPGGGGGYYMQPPHPGSQQEAAYYHAWAYDMQRQAVLQHQHMLQLQQAAAAQASTAAAAAGPGGATPHALAAGAPPPPLSSESEFGAPRGAALDAPVLPGAPETVAVAAPTWSEPGPEVGTKRAREPETNATALQPPPPLPLPQAAPPSAQEHPSPPSNHPQTEPRAAAPSAFPTAGDSPFAYPPYAAAPQPPVADPRGYPHGQPPHPRQLTPQQQEQQYRQHLAYQQHLQLQQMYQQPPGYHQHPAQPHHAYFQGHPMGVDPRMMYPQMLQAPAVVAPPQLPPAGCGLVSAWDGDCTAA